MYPNIPYEGLTWPITQHAGVISEPVLRGLLEACSLCAGRKADSSVINSFLVSNGVLTANFRTDSQQVDAWRDYQQILSELGLIFSTGISKEILLTPVAVAFIDGTISFEELLTLQLFKYQYPNGHKTQISPSLRDSFLGEFNYESVAHMQFQNGIIIRPAVLIWMVLVYIYKAGHEAKISVEEMQRYIVRCTKNSDVEMCASAIISSRIGNLTYPPLNRARRNMQDWMKLLGCTPLFELAHGELYLSKYSIAHIVELTEMCLSLCNTETFWIPTNKNYKWDWFAFYGNIDLSVSLIPKEGDCEEQDIFDKAGEDRNEIPAIGRNVILQPFTEIEQADLTKHNRKIVSEYDYRKSQKGRNLHDSMVNLIAQKCMANGATVYSDPKTVDLYVQYSGYEYLIEVKSITPTNFVARLRYAIGQVHQYNFLLPCAVNLNRRLVLAFTADVPANSWSIPFVTNYLDMDLLTLQSSRLKVSSNKELSHSLFA